jgi:hypothetical protein
MHKNEGTKFVFYWGKRFLILRLQSDQIRLILKQHDINREKKEKRHRKETLKLSPKYLVVYELIHPHPIHPGRAQHKSKKKQQTRHKKRRHERN